MDQYVNELKKQSKTLLEIVKEQNTFIDDSEELVEFIGDPYQLDEFNIMPALKKTKDIVIKLAKNLGKRVKAFLNPRPSIIEVPKQKKEDEEDDEVFIIKFKNSKCIIEVPINPKQGNVEIKMLLNGKIINKIFFSKGTKEVTVNDITSWVHNNMKGNCVAESVKPQQINEGSGLSWVDDLFINSWMKGEMKHGDRNRDGNIWIERSMKGEKLMMITGTIAEKDTKEEILYVGQAYGSIAKIWSDAIIRTAHKYRYEIKMGTFTRVPSARRA